MRTGHREPPENEGKSISGSTRSTCQKEHPHKSKKRQKLIGTYPLLFWQFCSRVESCRLRRKLHEVLKQGKDLASGLLKTAASLLFAC